MTNIWGHDIDTKALAKRILSENQVTIPEMNPGDIIITYRRLCYEVIRPYKRSVKVRALFVKTYPLTPFNERIEKLDDGDTFYRVTRAEAAAIAISTMQDLKERGLYRSIPKQEK